MQSILSFTWPSLTPWVLLNLKKGWAIHDTISTCFVTIPNSLDSFLKKMYFLLECNTNLLPSPLPPPPTPFLLNHDCYFISNMFAYLTSPIEVFRWRAYWFGVWRKLKSLRYNPSHYWSIRFSKYLMSREWKSLAKGWDTKYIYIYIYIYLRPLHNIYIYYFFKIFFWEVL